MKYTAPLDINSISSHSIILEQIKPNSIVLEFGPAQGQMTQFLKEFLSCKVTIIEIDKEAAAIASQFAEHTIICDIENMEWEKELLGQQFDYIIFADVIEHLREPNLVLLQAKHFLRYGGSIFVSTPNIAHNSVLLNLLRNKFQYTQTGILDNTHVKLFTKDSLLQLFEEVRLYPVKSFATYSKPGENEIPVSYKDSSEIPPYFWKCRKNGCVYQYIYELKKNYDTCLTYEDHIVEILPEYFLSMYDNEDHGLTDIKYKQFLNLENLIQEIEVIVPHSLKRHRRLNIALLNAPSVVEILEGYVIDSEKKTGIYISHHNADEAINNKYFFATNIPCIEIETNNDEFEKIYLRLKYSDVENVMEIQERIHDIQVLKSQFQRAAYENIKDEAEEEFMETEGTEEAL